MSEIEKMYENAGIKKVRQTNITGGDYPIAVGFEDYPTFTAEKQLSLIKWLGKNKNGFDVFYDTSFNSVFYDTSFNSKEKHYWCCADQYYEDFNYCYHKKEFDEALAGLINNLWQDLTSEEQEQIRSILNG